MSRDVESMRAIPFETARLRASDASFAAVSRARKAKTESWRVRALSYAEELRDREDKEKKFSMGLGWQVSDNKKQYYEDHIQMLQEELWSREREVLAFRQACERGQRKIEALERELARQRADEEVQRLRFQVKELIEEVSHCQMELHHQRTSMSMWQNRMMEEGERMLLLEDNDIGSSKQMAVLQEEAEKAKAELEWWKNYGLLMASALEEQEDPTEESDYAYLEAFSNSEPDVWYGIDELSLREHLERAERGWRCATSGTLTLARKLEEKDRLVELLQHEIDTYYSCNPRWRSPSDSDLKVQEVNEVVSSRRTCKIEKEERSKENVLDRLEDVLASSRLMRVELERQAMEPTHAASDSKATSSSWKLPTPNAKESELLPRRSMDSPPGSPSEECLRQRVRDALMSRVSKEEAESMAQDVRELAPGTFRIGNETASCVLLRRNVMVRVERGWSTLEEFLFS